jgi:hypothetical protein
MSCLALPPQLLFDLRKSKGVTIDQATDLAQVLSLLYGAGKPGRPAD